MVSSGPEACVSLDSESGLFALSVNTFHLSARSSPAPLRFCGPD